MSDDDLEVPVSSAGDKVHALTRAGLSAIPVLGGGAVELFQNVVQPPLERRRAAWMNAVGEKLKQLEDSVDLDLQKLQENEEFISTVMHASQLALKTHHDEKLAALKNAIANTALGQAPEEAVQHIFWGLIDSLSVLHIQILRHFQAPVPPKNMSMGGLSNVLELNFPQLRGRRDLYDQLWKDLHMRGLVVADGLHMTVSGSGLAQKQTTALADQFLAYISSSEE